MSSTYRPPSFCASIVRLSTFLAVALSITACKSGDEKAGDDAPAQATESQVATSPSASAGASSVTLSAAQITNGRITWTLPTMAPTSSTVEVPGQLVVNDDRTARLAAPVQARAIAVHVSPGDRVARGSRLVTLQSPDANAARSDVAKARAEVSSMRAAALYARSARDRAERLLALKAIPRQDYERAIADDELARAQLSQANSELVRARSGAQQLGVDVSTGSMTLRSPIAGVVTSREVAPGSVVEAGAPLISVTDPASLWLNVALPEQFVTGVRVGSNLRFTVAPFPRDTFTARVQSVSASYDPTTRSLPVRGLVINTGGRLRPEMFARVWVDGGSVEMLPTLPNAAIQRMGGKSVVFVVTTDTTGGARFEVREVETRATSGGRAAIIRGLVRNDLVVVQGAYAVKAEYEKGKMPDMEM